MPESTGYVIARRCVDFFLLSLIAAIAVIIVVGGFHTEIFGFSLKANTPAGPIKLLLPLLLLRAALVLETRDFLFLLASIIASLLLAEGLLRIWDAPITKFQLTQLHRPSPTTQWELIPGGSAVANTGATYRINSRGCRDAEYAPRKAAGAFRILALGDSFTFGMGVESEETYPKRLEQILRARGHTIEVINCAVIGYDMWQHQVALKKRLREYRPDLVILGLFVNDLMESYPPAEVRRPGYPGKNPFAKHGAKTWLHKSYLYNTIRNTEDLLKFRFRAKFGATHLQNIAERKKIWGPSHPENPYYKLLAGTADPGLYEAFGTALEEFVSSAKKSGAGVLLLLLPDSVQLHDDSMQEMNRLVAILAETGNIPFLDLTPVLENQEDPESLYLFPEDAHNSPKGLRIIAEAISEEIVHSRRFNLSAR